MLLTEIMAANTLEEAMIHFEKVVPCLLHLEYCGSESTSNWKFPRKDDGSMGDIKLANWRAWRFIENMDLLVNICISAEKEEETMHWNEAVELYTDTIKVCVLLLDVIS
jgi:hypothetical protein